MLQPAAAALSEVRAGRLDAIGRGHEDLVDRRAAEAATRFDEPHAQPIARQPAAHEDHVAIGTPDALAAESQILDRELERVAATRFRHGQRHYKGRSETSQFGGDFAVYHTDLMRSGAPRPVADVLAAAVPQIAERLPEYRVRRAWRALVGPDVSRRTQPQSLTNGCLHIIVDNSPWLSELTLRNTELTAQLHAQVDAVRSLRFTLGTLEAEPSPPAERRECRAKTLGDDDRRDIEAAASAISDPALADAARRLLTKARRADHARGVTR